MKVFVYKDEIFDDTGIKAMVKKNILEILVDSYDNDLEEFLNTVPTEILDTLCKDLIDSLQGSDDMDCVYGTTFHGIKVQHILTQDDIC